jgi:hypothetical protein
MPSANKRKGTAWESAIRDHAIKTGHKAFRPAQMGAGDIGDVHIDGLLCIQAKDTAAHRFGEWLSDVDEQRARAGLAFGAVVAKRRRCATGDAYAVMSYDRFLSLMKRLSFAESLISADPYIRGAYERLLTEKGMLP